MYKEELVKLIDSLDVDFKEFCLLSTAALVIRGLYDKAGDLDIAVTEKGFKELEAKYNLRSKENGWYIVSDEVECILDNDTVQNAEVIDKYKLQNLEEYYYFLKSSTREKDIIKRQIVEKELNK